MVFSQRRSYSLSSNCLAVFRQHPVSTAIAAAAGLLAATAIVNRQLARKALRDNPPKGGLSRLTGCACTMWSAERGGHWFCSTATAA